MRITTNSIQLYNNTYKKSINRNYPNQYKSDLVTFSGTNKNKEKHIQKLKYKTQIKLLNLLFSKNLVDYDLDKLEGIQEGIKIFEGLNMKEIAFMFDDLHTITVKRGCSNQCLHCYAGAKPSGKDHEDYITRMPYETFCELTDGIKQLKERIGITPISHRKEGYTDIYYDADCMEISLYDKYGSEHDYIELVDKFYDATETPSIFDTAGWNPKNKKMQERAEKYVNYMLDLDNQKKFHQINLSFSPFNAIYAKGLELGYNPEHYSPLIPIEDLDKPMSKGEKLYRIYIDRMANTLYTFTPLLGEKKFSIISRPVENSEVNMKNFTVEDYERIKNHILQKLYLKYFSNPQINQKHTLSEEQILSLINKYDQLLSKIDTNLIPSGRYKELYMKRNPELSQEEFESKYNYVGDFNSCFESLKKSRNLKDTKLKYLKIIDANGKLYLYDTLRFIPTEISLNLSTKDKITPKLTPDVTDDFIITRKMIKNQYK